MSENGFTAEQETVPEALISRLMDNRRQLAGALQTNEAILQWLGVLPSEKRLLLSREERLQFQRWLREAERAS